MLTKCPQCGKIVDVWQEELSLRGGMVVCPQCLTPYDSQHQAELPAGHRTPVATTRKPQRHYCTHCGHALQGDINYCPYCGTSVKKERQATLTKQPPVISAAATIAATTPPPPVKPASGSNAVWQPVLPSYRLHAPTRRQPASLRFRIAAVIVIAILLAVLGLIVHAGMQLS